MKKTLYMYAIVTVAIALIAVATQNGFAAVVEAPQPAAVKIDNFSFAPANLEIPAGTQVRWTNKDDIPHNIVSEDKSFKSKVLDTDDEFTYTFSQPGTYKYFCGLHPKMTATVVVK